MLRAMVQLAPREATTGDVASSVGELRKLAEFPAVGERAYVIEQDPSGAVIAKVVEVNESTRYGFPFRRPSGPRSPQLGPVLKRTLDPKKGVGPNATTVAATLSHFEAIAASNTPAARIYRLALEVAGAGDVAQKTARMIEALTSIPEKKTVYVSLGEPPGNDPDYAARLLEVISSELYGIDDDAPEGVCPVCGRTARLGAGALKGAKVNFFNMDNHGVFPDLDIERATDRFAMCAACAGSVANTYINLKAELRVIIAGAPALVLPYVVAPASTGDASHSAWDVVKKAREGKATDAAEGDLLFYLAEESSLAAFHILWATAGDSLDDVTGFITDVPCTRLGELSVINKAANAWSGGVLPAPRMPPGQPFDLKLSLVGELLQHPGGKRTERRNKGGRLGALRKQVARAVYLRHERDREPLMNVLMSELRDIIADHLVDPSVDDRFVAYNLTREPPPPKKQGAEIRLNAASWIRHVALLLHYLRHLEVLPPMNTAELYVPRSERLTKLLAEPSGVNTDAKMFAFLVGVLFGRLLTVQGGKGVNVRSNALTWLRRATLTGSDLPSLYVRIREKFAEYGTEGSPVLREVVRDTSELGRRLGTDIPLDADITMYFLFLGQALAGDVFTKDTETTAEEAR
jgi:CRISPR-associated protein Csh1